MKSFYLKLTQSTILIELAGVSLHSIISHCWFVLVDLNKGWIGCHGIHFCYSACFKLTWWRRQNLAYFYSIWLIFLTCFAFPDESNLAALL